MHLYDEIDLQDCPLCEGGAFLEEEENNCFYVSCIDCGCHTVTIGYKKPEERADAAKRAAYLWNVGKVISSAPGE